MTLKGCEFKKENLKEYKNECRNELKDSPNRKILMRSLWRELMKMKAQSLLNWEVGEEN